MKTPFADRFSVCITESILLSFGLGMIFSTYLGAGKSSAVYGTVIKHFGYLPLFVSWGILSAAAF